MKWVFIHCFQGLRKLGKMELTHLGYHNHLDLCQILLETGLNERDVHFMKELIKTNFSIFKKDDENNKIFIFEGLRK